MVSPAEVAPVDGVLGTLRTGMIPPGRDHRGLGAQQGSGLEGMRERANLVNGYLEIQSIRGQGTRVVLNTPFLSK